MTLPTTAPTLQDEHVILRAVTDADIPGLVAMCQDPEMVRWTTVPAPYDESHARWWVEHVTAAWQTGVGECGWVIAEPSRPDRVLGTIAYRPEDAGRGDLGFALHPDGRGRGLMSAAVRLVCSYAFDHGCEVMSWSARVGNWGSKRVAWACGFTMAGTIPGMLGGDRGISDAWVATLRRGAPMAPTRAWLEASELVTDTLRLRPWRAQDVDDLVDPDADAQRFMPYGAMPFLGDFEAWRLVRDTRMSVGEGIYWCVADRHTDRPLGHAQLFRLDVPFSQGSAELGYWLLPSARGQGVMTAAVETVAAFAFTAADAGGLGLHRLAAGIDADNTPSAETLRRCRFRQIGVERRIMHREGEEPGDGILWERLRDDPERPVAPVIDDELVRLRPWRITDESRIVQGCSDPRTAHWLGRMPRPYTDLDARDYVWSSLAADGAGDRVHFALADPVTDELLGSLALMHVDDGVNEIGYWAHPDARGRGVMTEATRLAIRHAFTDREDGGLGCRRLVLRAAVANTASRHVAEAAGFLSVGVTRQAERLGDGTYADLVTYELLPTDPT